MLLAQVEPIAPEETAADLFESLAEVGAHLMVKTLAHLEQGSVEPIEQDHSKATLAPLLTRDDGRMDFTLTPETLRNRWRGFQPWPGLWTMLRGKKLSIHALAVSTQAVQAGVLMQQEGRLFVGCAGGSVELLELQLEGKKRMTAADFLRGFALQPNERLGA